MKPDEIRNIIEDFLSYNSYDTGWIACSDWTDQHLGDTVGGNVTHNLNAPLSDLLVKVLISTDSTDDNSLEAQNIVRLYDAASPSDTRFTYGHCVYQIDENTIKVQTGLDGFQIIDDDGDRKNIDTESYYYKVKILKLWY